MRAHGAGISFGEFARRAVAVWKKLAGTPLVTSNHVLDEP